MLEFFKKLEKSKEFKSWSKENKDWFLYNCFTIIDKEEDFWQFDFYNKKLNKITSFKVSEDIEIFPEDDIFSDGKRAIKKLDLKDIKIEFNEVSTKLRKKHKTQGIVKEIVILQNSGGLVWNISLLTSTMTIINTKISASTGKILEEKSESVLKFREN